MAWTNQNSDARETYPCQKNSKSLWRPQLHMHGGMSEGLHECFFISDSTVAKGSNLECTLAARMLELAHLRLQVSLVKPMPRIFRLHVDNAASEGKNNCMAHFLGQLVHRRLFDQGVPPTIRK